MPSTSSTIVVSDPTEIAQRIEAARSEGYEAGFRQAITEERQRIQAIINHDSATGRTAIARHLAFTTDLSVKTCVALLNTAPLEQPAPKRTNRLVAAMARTKKPGVSNANSVDSEEGSRARDALSRAIGERNQVIYSGYKGRFRTKRQRQ